MALDPSLKEVLIKRGIKTTTRDESPFNYVGAASLQTFRGMANRHVTKFTVANNMEVAVLGEAYTGAPYRSGTSSANYESVYGNYDWAKAEEDPNLKRVLDESFGNTGRGIPDPAASEALLKAAYSNRIPVPNTRGLAEQSQALLNAQAESLGLPDEDTAGIRGVDDDDVALAPTA